SDASWNGRASTSLCSSLTTLFMDGYLSPVVPDSLFRALMTYVRTGEKRTAFRLPSGRSGVMKCERTAVRQPPSFVSPAPQPRVVGTRCATQHLVLGSKA